ncbi:MAG: D-Ala-D-Ala carboxypeptidase family metallohydrolase [Candidatus Paceibacterota bacterium]|jgi:hypothetical protein
MPIRKLTEHFTYNEFFNADSGVVSEYDIEKATKLATILEPVRVQFNFPVRINSGKRSEVHNKKIGGVPTSEHCYKGDSAACDFTLGKSELNQAAFEYLHQNRRNDYGQLIIYKNRDGQNIFIHMSLATKKRSGATLVATYEEPRKYFVYTPKK